MAEKESKQSSNIVWVVLAGILGLFALGSPKSSEEKSASRAGQEPNKELKEASQPFTQGKGPLEPLDSFFSTRKEQKNPFTARDHEQLGQFEREYLILTVPDPLDSQFGYRFDQLMDVTQRALEMQGYVFHRAWLPWELDKQKTSGTRIVTDWRELAALVFPLGRREELNEGAGNYREENPGTLLFRRHLPKTDSRLKEIDSLCVVFLVGENPTSGIDKRAFAEAVRMIRAYPPKKDKTKIRVVGPFFTGSQTSLRFALHDSRNRGLSFEVISGGASGVDPNWLCKSEGNGVRVTFHATVIPGKEILKAVLHYLTHRNLSDSRDFIRDTPPEKVALIVESNTGFGQSISQSPLPGKRNLAPLPEKRDHAPSPRTDDLEPRIVEFPFPLHISRLRSTYEEERRRRNEQLGLPSIDSLVPPLRTRATDRDSIPAQDPTTTSSINGEVLEDILSTINREVGRSRERIRYVGIIATDPRDQVMLASLVREHCPGVQIFLIGADVLFTLPEYSYFLKGTIVASVYPLIPENQFWTDPKIRTGKRLSFPGQDAQGYFNAILAQFEDREHMIEYNPPRFHDAEVLPEGPQKPPVWITMIGQNGDFVPLQFFTHLCPEADRYVWPTQKLPSEKDVERFAPPFPTTARIALGVIVALCLLVVGYALTNGGFLLFWDGPEWPGRRSLVEQLTYRLVCLGSLILLLAPVIELCWIAGGNLPWRLMDVFHKIFLAMPLAALFLLVWFLFSPFLSRWNARQPANAAPFVNWIPYGLGVLVVVAGGIAIWSDRAFPQPLTSWQALFFERALNVTSGASPLLPWVLVGLTFFFWSYYQLRRCYFAERFLVANPYPAGSVPGYHFEDIDKIERKLRSEIRSSLTFVKEHPIPSAVFLVIVVLGAIRVGLQYQLTAEGPIWSWLLFTGITAGFFLVALDLLRFLLVWWRLKKLLGDIALTPMTHAFDHLPAKIVSTFWGHLSPRRPRLAQLHIPHHQIGLLRAETERLLAKPLRNKKQVQPYLSQLREIQMRLASFSPRDFDARIPSIPEEDRPQALSKRFGKVTRRLLKLLPKFWPHHPLKDAFGGDAVEAKPDQNNAPKKSRKMGVLQAWIELAEDLVAIQVVIYLSQFFIQLRNLAWSMIICSTLLLLGATSYPFQPERLILLLLLSLIGGVIGGILYVLVRINQDEVVSRISRTTPNRFNLDWGFVSSIFTYVVPVVSIVVLQMFGGFRFMLEPLVRVLR